MIHAGMVSAGLADEILGIARHAHHLEPRLLEHPHDALADERLILAEPAAGLGATSLTNQRYRSLEVAPHAL